MCWKSWKPFARPLVELAFAWLLAHPEVSSVIAGATTPEQITANAKAADWHLSAVEMAEMDDPTSTGSHMEHADGHLGRSTWWPFTWRVGHGMGGFDLAPTGILLPVHGSA